MRTLLINPEFPASFWTFKKSSEHLGRGSCMPPLGLITVASLLPESWECRLVDLNTRQITEADWEWAELVMLTGMLIQRQGLLELIREAKRRGKSVVVGGPYATSSPHEIVDAGAHFLLRGEGESVIPRWLADLKGGKPGGVWEEDGKPEMTDSPMPRFDLLNLRDYLAWGVQTSRGCPFNCEFCDVINLYGRNPRYKRPAQVLAELEVIYNLGYRGRIFFCDDNFIGNPDQALSLLRELIPWMKSHGEPFEFWTQVSVNLGQNKDMIDLLTEANFSTVFIGVETPDAKTLALNRKYQNLRNPLGQSLTDIGANGLSVMASFIVGFDQEESGAGDRICDFVEQNSIPMVVVNLLNVLPQTGLWDRLQGEGRLLEQKTHGDFYLACKLNYVPTRPEEEITAEYVRSVECLYDHSRFLSRAYRHILSMRPTRRFLALARGQPPDEPVKQERATLNTAWDDLKEFGALIWRQGVRFSCRAQFWRQLWGVYRRNPSRLKRYLSICAMGEDLFWVREQLLTRRGSRVT